MKRTFSKENEMLQSVRHSIGYYSIRELQVMFSGCGRAKIDYLVNSGKLKFISPNNREKYIKLEDFLFYLQNEKELSKQQLASSKALIHTNNSNNSAPLF